MGDCTYCGKRRINFNQDEDYTMRIENNDRGDYVIVTGELMIDSIPISFCPFCGQPIAKKPYTRATNNTHLRQGVIRCDCGVELRINVDSEYRTRPLLKTTWYHLPLSTVLYSGDENDTDSVIQFTKDELVKRWNFRSDNDYR